MDGHILLFLFLLTAISAKSHSEEEQKKEEVPLRALISGDTFTPIDLYPVAEKLILKIKQPGEGKGIVSGARSAEELADKIFTGFFLTSNRIVVLSDIDIDGLDSLQALALSGLDVNTQDDIDEVKEDGSHILAFEGRTLDDMKPKYSKFRIMVKKLDRNGRRALKIAEKLGKIRRIKVNAMANSRNVIKKPKNDPKSKDSLRTKNGIATKKAARRNGENNVEITTESIYRNMSEPLINPVTPVPMPSNEFTTSLPTDKCKWKYQCEPFKHAKSCDAIIDCNENCHPGKEDEWSIYHREDEHTPELKKFRKMIGITLVDEEIEKIIQRRVLTKRPLPRVYDGPVEERVETLSQYFNHIMDRKQNHGHGGASTQPGVPRAKHLDEVTKNPGVQNESPKDKTSSKPKITIEAHLVRVPPYEIFPTEP